MREVNRRTFLKGLGITTAALVTYGGTDKILGPALEKTAKASQQVNRFSEYGSWTAEFQQPGGKWRSGQSVEGEVLLHVPAATLLAMETDDLIPDRWLCLVTAERLFDAKGDLRLLNGIGCSTFLSPTGLAVEGGLQGALSSKTEKVYRAYVDVTVEIKNADATQASGGGAAVRFPFAFKLAEDVPAGVVRLRFDFGVGENRPGHVNHRHSLNGEGFARYQREGWSGFFSGPIALNMDLPKTRMPWVLMSRWGSNGQRGIVADEDKGRFALSPRHIAPADPIFPREDAQGRNQEYDILPEIMAWKSDKHRQIELAADAGSFSADLQMPSGKVLRFENVHLAPTPDGSVASTDPKAGRWRPEEYGEHVVRVRGYCTDAWGNRHESGGTYHFWIAERLTVATATFLGLAFQTGQAYGAPIAVNPPFPAEVAVELTVFPASDPQRRKAFNCSGRATEGGVFGPAEGLKSFMLEEAGEYIALIRAKATDSKGRLWMASLTHAGVVFPPDTSIEARGKKIKVGQIFTPRGETHFEGYIEAGQPPLPANGKYTKADLKRFRFLDHINYPWFPQDALLIASEGHGANKIEPVLTYVRKGEPEEAKRGTLGIGQSELQIPPVDGGWDPFTHPERVSKKGGYWFAAAPRPGFPSRFMVATNGVFAPYWPTSNTNFGGQIGASQNGDMSGDIYRLLGGVVVPEKAGPPSFAGYMASAFILPAGSENNRVVAPGSEDVPGADGRLGRFFLVAVRPGSVYGAGAMFSPFLQIDPVVPAQVRYELISPSGKNYRAEGVGNMSGYFIGKDSWKLNEPGVWIYRLHADLDGKPGRMPGLPSTGGWIFVTEERDISRTAKMDLGLPAKMMVDPATGFKVQGTTTARKVFLSALVPGCILGQWELPVQIGRFEWSFDPAAIHEKVPIYDIRNTGNGKAQLGRVVHLTFFAQEISGVWAWGRIVVRGPVALTGA